MRFGSLVVSLMFDLSVVLFVLLFPHRTSSSTRWPPLSGSIFLPTSIGTGLDRTAPSVRPSGPMYENGEDDLIPEAHPDCLQWVKERVLYSLALEKEDAWSDEATNHATQFLVDNKVKRLFAQVDPEAGLITGIMQHTAGNPAPPDQAVLIIYFFKRDATEVVPENIDNAVHFGVMLNNGMDSFLRVMQHVYAPTLLRNRQWPESIQKDFSAQLHRFLAGLTENVNRMKGCTVLYVPQEDIEEAAQDKDRVQRFESALIHWTRQIKDVLNEKDNVESSENEGPLAEIEFWRARTEDLNNIRNQLERNDVKQIVEVCILSLALFPFGPCPTPSSPPHLRQCGGAVCLNRSMPYTARCVTSQVHWCVAGVVYFVVW